MTEYVSREIRELGGAATSRWFLSGTMMVGVGLDKVADGSLQDIVVDDQVREVERWFVNNIASHWNWFEESV